MNLSIDNMNLNIILIILIIASIGFYFYNSSCYKKLIQNYTQLNDIELINKKIIDSIIVQPRQELKQESQIELKQESPIEFKQESQIEFKQESPIEFKQELKQESQIEFKQEIIKEKKLKTVVLYYATWCTHCHHVLPYFKELMESNNNEVIYSIVESKELEKMPEIYNKIGGFPTIIIYYGNNEITYNGPRNKERLVEFINELK